MRPKVVILTLVAAFAVLGMVVVFKGLKAGNSGNTNGQTLAVDATMAAPSATTNDQSAQTSLNSGSTSANSEEWRAAMIQKELDAIQGLVGAVDGTNNPMIISALIDKVENPEADVRKAALAALVQLNDTNAVPELQKAADAIKDPRAKVAVLDTIDYLNLPDSMPAVQPPETFTNNPVPTTMPKNIRMNPKFLHTNDVNLPPQ